MSGMGDENPEQNPTPIVCPLDKKPCWRRDCAEKGCAGFDFRDDFVRVKAERDAAIAEVATAQRLEREEYERRMEAVRAAAAAQTRAADAEERRDRYLADLTRADLTRADLTRAIARAENAEERRDFYRRERDAHHAIQMERTAERDAALARAETAERERDEARVWGEDHTCRAVVRAENAERRAEKAERALVGLREALRRGLAVWCPHGNPGGDGADGETWAYADRAIADAEPIASRVIAEAEERGARWMAEAAEVCREDPVEVCRAARGGR